MKSALLTAALAGTAGALRAKHVIYLMMENHSFDNMLGNLPGCNGVNASVCNTYQGQQYCATNKGQWVDTDPGHSIPATALGIYGTMTPADEHNQSAASMGGFVLAYAQEQHNNATAGAAIMDCFDPSHVPIISTLAQEFTVIDGYHASVPGPTYPNRLFAMSGTSWGYGDNSVNQSSPGWPQTSIFGALQTSKAAGGANAWRSYFLDMSTPMLFADTRGGLFTDNFRPMSVFFADVAAGDLPPFTWLDPGYFGSTGVPPTDQHPPHDVRDGEALIKQVYEALRASPLWNDSVLLLTYDEHGGFMDHVPTPVTGVPNPDGRPCVEGCSPTPFSFTRLGIRVPMLVISPWADKGRVVSSPTNTSFAYYEHSSLPATLQQLYPDAFPTGPLTARAAWSPPLTDLWEGTDMPNGPRTDAPTTLPPVPFASSSSGSSEKVWDGTAPLSKQQKELLALAEAVAHQARGLAMELLPSEAQLEQQWAAAGVTTEAAAGAYVQQLLAAAMAAGPAA